MKRVSRDILIRALKNTIGSRGIPDEAIEGLADYILELFGFEEAISDEILTPADRDIFYMLEDEGILSTDMDEVPITVKHGKRWMIHYWRLRTDVILALASEGEETEEGETGEYDIYEEEELWKRDGEE